ncbi:MAG: hypothetical protein SV201_08850 [Pseudomonadota bacterium]|nr:hypothetical protein [Pseudomonadota bacterium]
MAIKTNLDEQVHAFEEKTETAAEQSDQYGLQILRDMQSLSRVLASRELRRLKNKLGEEHPRVRDLQRGLKRTAASLQDAEKTRDDINRKVPETEPGETLMHGKIKDELGKGVTGLSVVLHDQSGNELEIDNVRTDKTGYFSTKISSEVMEQAKNTDWTFSVRRDDGIVIYSHENNIKLAPEKNLLINAVVSRDKLRPVEVNERLKQPFNSQTKARRKPVPVNIDALKSKGYVILGNKRSREIHDLGNIQKGCQIDEIAMSNRMPFKSEKDAVEKGYDYCAYCFGPEKSKH